MYTKSKVKKLVKQMAKKLKINDEIDITFKKPKECSKTAVGACTNNIPRGCSRIFINLKSKEDLKETILHELLHVKHKDLLSVMHNLEEQLTNCEYKTLYQYLEKFTDEMSVILADLI